MTTFYCGGRARCAGWFRPPEPLFGGSDRPADFVRGDPVDTSAPATRAGWDGITR